MPIKKCFMVGCDISVDDIDDAGANENVQDHVIRCHAEELSIEKIRIQAKTFDKDEDQFIKTYLDYIASQQATISEKLVKFEMDRRKNDVKNNDNKISFYNIAKQKFIVEDTDRIAEKDKTLNDCEGSGFFCKSGTFDTFDTFVKNENDEQENTTEKSTHNDFSDDFYE